MFDDEEIKKSLGQEKKRESTEKYKPLPRNRKTERDMQRIFEFGSEDELTDYLLRTGVPADSEWFAQIVKLFRDYSKKRL